MFRGLGKFVAVAVAAAVVGAAIGIGLASLTGGDDSPTASAPSVSTATGTATAVAPAPVPVTTRPAVPPPPPARTQTQTTTTGAPTRFLGPVPKIDFASATIGAPAGASERALVAVKVTVTNRYTRTLPLKPPALISGADKVPLDPAAKSVAGPLLSALDPKASATGELRFTLPTAVTKRLTAAPTAKLRIAGRTVVLTLTPTG